MCLESLRVQRARKGGVGFQFGCYKLPSWFATVSRSDCRFFFFCVPTWLSDRCDHFGVVLRLTPLTEEILGINGAAGWRQKCFR